MVVAFIVSLTYDGKGISGDTFNIKQVLHLILQLKRLYLRVKKSRSWVYSVA